MKFSVATVTAFIAISSFVAAAPMPQDPPGYVQRVKYNDAYLTKNHRKAEDLFHSGVEKALYAIPRKLDPKFDQKESFGPHKMNRPELVTKPSGGAAAQGGATGGTGLRGSTFTVHYPAITEYGTVLSVQ